MAGTKITVVRYDPTDPRLGRHVEHDERSRLHALMPKAQRPQHKTTFWTSQAGPLNQLDVGSCTTHSECQWNNTDFATALRMKVKHGNYFTDDDAYDLYRLTTKIDKFAGKWEPDDTGSTGNSAAKAARKKGWLSGYSWLFSFTSLQAAIEKTPLMVGTLWTNNMFDPNNGLVKVGSLSDSNIAGGHEYLMCGIDWNEEVFNFRNSWGDEDDWPGCKPGGYFAISFADFRRLQDADGDATVPRWT